LRACLGANGVALTPALAVVFTHAETSEQSLKNVKRAQYICVNKTYIVLYSWSATLDITHVLPNTAATLRPIIVLEDVVPESAEMLLLPNLIHILDLLGRQLERIRSQVITQPLLLSTRRNRHNVLVHAPPKVDLVLPHSILLRQCSHVVVQRTRLGFGGRSERRIGDRGNVVLLVEFEEFWPLQVGVELDLVAYWLDFRGLQGGGEMVREIVGDADGLCETGCLNGFHVGPCFLEVFV